jgi:hypothetical protein
MKQDSALTRRLAQAQEDVAAAKRASINTRTSDNFSVVWRLYTERFPNLAQIVGFYFKGATLFDATGLWEGATESSTVIEIISTRAKQADILALAEDICAINNQSEVLITSEAVKHYSVTQVAL